MGRRSDIRKRAEARQEGAIRVRAKADAGERGTSRVLVRQEVVVWNIQIEVVAVTDILQALSLSF